MAVLKETLLQTHTTETHFVKAVGGGLNLGSLHHVHETYRQVVHDEIGVEEGSAVLSRLLRDKPIYHIWQRVLIAAGCAGVISMIGWVTASVANEEEGRSVN